MMSADDFGGGESDSDAGSGSGGGTGSNVGLAMYYGQPMSSTNGGIYERAIDLQPGVPFQAPVGSGAGPLDVADASFQALDSLIIGYIDNYFQTLANRDTSGSVALTTVTGSNDVGSYTFVYTLSYNYQETGNPTGTFSVSDTDSMSYSFYETGVDADSVSFTLSDNGTANSTSKFTPGTNTSGTHTLTNVLSGSSTYTLGEQETDTGSLSQAAASDSTSEQISGSVTDGLSEYRTVTVNAGNQILSGKDADTFTETDNDTWTSSSVSQSAGGGAITGGSETLTDSSSLTDTGSQNDSLTISQTDVLLSYGSLSYGNRSFSYHGTSNDSPTLYELDTDSIMIDGGGTYTESDSQTMTVSDAVSTSQVETGTETYTLAGGAWDETGTDSLSTSETDEDVTTGSGLDTSNLGGVTSSATSTFTGSETTTLIEAGTITQTMAQVNSFGVTNETIGSGSSAETWNEAGTLTTTVSDTDSEVSSSTLTTSSTLAGVTDSQTVTDTDSPQSTTTETGTDVLSLYETGNETYASSGLVSGGTITRTLTDTAGGDSTTGISTDVYKEHATETIASQVSGQTVSETIVSSLTDSSTDTPTETDSSSSTLWTTDTLTAGGVSSIGIETQTLYDLSTDTDTLGATTTAGDADTVTESDSLGGVTSTESMTSTPSSTETDGQTTTVTGTETATSSLTTSAGFVSSSGGGDSLFESSSDTYTSLIVAGGGSTAAGTSSSNLGGTTAHGTNGGTTTDASTLTINGSGTRTDTSTDSELAGTLGLSTGGGSSDSTSMTDAEANSLYEVDTGTQSETDTVTATAGGLTSTETDTAHSTDTATSTLAGGSTETDTMTDTVTVGTGGVITSGSDTASSTVTESGSQTLYDADTDALNTTLSETTTLAGVTENVLASAIENDLATTSQFGPYQETSTETSNDTLGPGGLSAGGGDAQTHWDVSTLTTTDIESSTITTTEHTTDSSTLSGVTDHDSVTDTDTLNGGGRDTGTLWSTETQTANTSYGIGDVVLGGGDWDSLVETGTDSSNGASSDTATVTGTDVSSFSDTESTSSVTDTSTVTDSQSLTVGGSSSSGTTETSTLTLGSSGLITGGSVSNTLLASDGSTDTLTGTSTLTDHDSGYVTDNAGDATDSQYTTNTITGTVTSSESDSLTDFEWAFNTVTLGANDSISAGSSTTTLTSSDVLVTFSDHETDSDTGTVSGSSSTTQTGTQSTSSFYDQLTASPLILNWGTGSSSSSMTESVTVGAGGLVTGGTAVEGDTNSETSTESQSEVQTTTESQSVSITASADSTTDSSSDKTSLTGTLTDTITDSSPSNQTETDGGTNTLGTSAVISGGTDSSSLYETDSDSPYDGQTGILISTETSSENQNNTGLLDNATVTTTTTMMPSQSESSGDSTTQTDVQTETLGSNATVVGGTATSTVTGGGWDTLSLYETEDSSFTSTAALAQGTSGSFHENSGVSGSGSSTLTITDTNTYSTANTTTATLGTNAVISGGSAHDNLYETGNDSTTGQGAGANVRDFIYSGDSSDSSTYSTTYSSGETAGATVTQSDSQTQTLTTSGDIASGTEISTLASTSFDHDDYSENGDRTVSWGANNYDAGSYSDMASDIDNLAVSSSSSLTLGTLGEVGGGTATTTTTQSDSTSAATDESGSAYDSDPEGGQPFTGALTQSSLTTSSDFTEDRAVLFLGLHGAISDGLNFFNSTQSNTDTHSLNTSGSSETDSVNETGNDSFSQAMAGTETYGTLGAVSGGSDSFTWEQSATDSLVMVEHGGGLTVGGTPNYILTLTDQISSSFSDAGTDILGASDAILGGCDYYIETGSRDVASTLTDDGTTASPIYAEANGLDDYSSSDTGSSTLTTNGSVYSTDSFNYSENSGNTATDSVFLSSGGSSQINTGSASDGYTDNDTGIMTRSNTTTTSYDSFSMGDSHWISGSVADVTTNSTSSLSYNDAATDSDTVSAGGDYNTSAGNSYSFLDGETSNDVFSLADNIYGQWSGTFNEGSNETQSMAGYTSPSSYSYTQLSDYADTNSEGGNTTAGTVTSPYSDSGSSNGTYDYGISGPPAATVTLENTGTSTETSSGSAPSPPIQLLLAGNAVSAGESVADNIGTFAANGAVHDGTTQPVLDESQGLISALGGQLMHPLEFKGAEITPTQSGSGILLDEPNESNPSFGTTSWISHPSNLGYLRPSSGSSSIGGSLGGSSGGGTSGSAGISPSQDSGTSNGSSQDEVTRLENFNGGAAMNPTSTQGTTSSRAQQRAVGGGGGGAGANSDWSSFLSNLDAAGNALDASIRGVVKPMNDGINGMSTWVQQNILGMPGPQARPMSLHPSYSSGTGSGGTIAGTCGTGLPAVSPQAKPGGAAPAAANDNSLSLQDFVNNPGAFGSNLASGFGKALIGTVAIGGLLLLLGAAGPTAATVAVAAGVILLGVGLYTWYQQYNTITTGIDASGTPVSKQERVAMTGDLLGQIFGSLLGGKALKGLNEYIPSNWATKVDSWWNGTAKSPVEMPAAPEPGAEAACAETSPSDSTGPNCFPAGTLVATADGPKAIERIGANECVWARDMVLGAWRLCRVIEPSQMFYAGDIIGIKLARETIESTGAHPFWVVTGTELAERPEPSHVPAREPGDETPGRWVDARDLRVGDLLLRRTNELVRIEEIDRRLQRLAVYNVRVDELHNYAVGDGQVLAHNPTECGGGSGASEDPAARARAESDALQEAEAEGLYSGERRTLQTGGNTIKQSTADALGVQRRVLGRALEALKYDLGLRNNHHGKIMSNGDYVDTKTGDTLGNILDYLD